MEGNGDRSKQYDVRDLSARTVLDRKRETTRRTTDLKRSQEKLAIVRTGR